MEMVMVSDPSAAPDGGGEPPTLAPEVLDTEPAADTPEPEPTIADVLSALRVAQGQARVAEQATRDLGARIDESERTRERSFASLVNVMDEPGAEGYAAPPAEPASTATRGERFAQALEESKVTDQAVTAASSSQDSTAYAMELVRLQGQIEGEIGAAGLNVQAVLQMQQAATAMGDTSLQPTATDANALIAEWRERLIPLVRQRQAQAGVDPSNPTLTNGAPQGTPATPGTSAAAGFKTFGDVEDAFNDSKIDQARLVELAKTFPEGRRFLERLEKNR
jgi:hypothetical protein